MMFSSSYRNIRQLDSMQCGIACLATICCNLGIKYSLNFLNDLCSPSREGVSMKAIADVAGIIGFDVTGAKATFEQLADCPLPCIVHWNGNHFVVVYKIQNNKIYVADPAKGNIKYNKNDFIKHWIPDSENGNIKGLCLLLETNECFGKLKEPAVDKVRNPFFFILSYLRAYSSNLAMIMLGLLLTCVLQLVMPFLTQSIVDVGINERRIGFIWLILAGEFMILTGRVSTDFIRRWIILHISTRINVSLISDFLYKLLKLPMSFFEMKLTGDLLQRMGDHSRIQNFLTSNVLSITFSVISLIVFGCVLLVYNSIIFTIFTSSTIVYSLWSISFMKRRRINDYEYFERMAATQNHTYQFITCAQEIKLQGCGKRRRWEWEDSQADLFDINRKMLSLQQTQEAGAVFIREIGNILIIVIAATSVINGNLTMGAMLAVQYIVGQLASPVEQIISFVYSVQDVKISLERINDIQYHQDENSNSPDLIKTLDQGKSIFMNNVDFRYDRHSMSNIIDGMSISITEGKTTAIVGASGSGKSTVMKLLLGYYKPITGDILIGNRKLSDYDIDWFRSRCGVVTQDSMLFSESIIDNIASGDEYVNFDRAIEAAQLACIHDFIMTLPMKYRTKIGREGVGLSEGQKQRILIARIIYKNPDFIFLDEATNSLDTKNERDIVGNLLTFCKGKTVVIIAHRLSTIKHADNIVVMDGGVVVESGSHETLLAKDGFYHNLVKNQLQIDTSLANSD